MGDFMRQDDILIPSLLDLLNLRFAPNTEDPKDDLVGGLDEMVALQKEFKIFQEARSFRDSAAILNLGGFWNVRAKKRWLSLLEHIGTKRSNVAGQNGSEAIVRALIGNLESRKPLPVHFTAHDQREKDRNQVLIEPNSQPIFYMRREYLTISLPMRPQTSTAGMRVPRPRSA